MKTAMAKGDNWWAEIGTAFRQTLNLLESAAVPLF
jgi:hypothetical protein